MSRTADVQESSDLEVLGVWGQDLEAHWTWRLTGLAAGGRCEPAECTSHRNRRSVRKFLSRPTNEGQRRRRGKWEKGVFLAMKNGRLINVGGDSFALNQMELTFDPRAAQILPSVTPHSPLTCGP